MISPKSRTGLRLAGILAVALIVAGAVVLTVDLTATDMSLPTAKPRPTADTPELGITLREPPTPLPGTLAEVPNELTDMVALTLHLGEGPNQSVHLRELVRQAFALAAREECGLYVRDAALREQPPTGLPTDRILSIKHDPDSSSMNTAWTFSVGPDGTRNVASWTRRGGDLAHGWSDFEEFLGKLEAATRTVFPEVLKAARFPTKPPQRSTAAVPAEVETLLGQVDVASQFQAIRRLHAAVREQGESDALTAGLARGYANLSLLTEPFWSDARIVFRVRAMLYGQRLVARSPKSPAALRVRAYALGICGLHGRALDDLLKADELPVATADDGLATPWLPTLDAYLHFDSKALAAARIKTDSPLAGLLAYLIVEAPTMQVAAVKTAREFLSETPECSRVHEGLCRANGVSNLHTATVLWLRAHMEFTLPGVLDTPGLPDSVQDAAADRDATEADLYEALRTAGRADRADLTWATLVGLTQDARFLATWWRLYFLGHMYGVETKDDAEALLPGLTGHPLQLFIESFIPDKLREPKAVAAKLKVPADYRLDGRSYLLGERIKTVDRGGHEDWMLGLVPLYAFTYEDLLRNDRIDKSPGFIWEAISPHAPETVIQQFKYGPVTPERLAEVEAAYPDNPLVQDALAFRHQRDGRFEDSVRCRLRRIELSSDNVAYRYLARQYLDQGREDDWLEAMEASLETEDPGLGHAKARVTIAEHFMEKRDYARAEPYAEKAAESYAAWALQCAADCKVKMGKWDEGNALYKACARRYPRNCFEWYFAARKHSELDLSAARKSVEEFLEGFPDEPRLGLAVGVGRFHILEGRLEDGIRQFNRYTQIEKSTQYALLIALGWDELGDTTARDAMLKATLAAPPDEEFGFLRPVIEVMQGWLTTGTVPDEKAVADVLANLSPAERADTSFYLGWYLANRGQTDRAKRLWKACLETEEGIGWLKTHSYNALNPRPAKLKA